MNSKPSFDFLSSVLDNMDTLTAPFFSTFQTSQNNETKQSSPLFELPNNVLDNIVSYIPLKVRTLAVAPVCRALRDSVYRSINSVAFYKTQLDELSDTRIKYFLSIHGSKITAINFDLFRSVEDEACTQWSWRQSVITAVKMCSNLRELDILICKRHRLRDTDLLTIFRQCPQLQVLCIDAQYLSGHCFQIAPVGLIRLELEMCLRLSELSMRYIFTRLKKLKVLYFSQLKILNDQIVSGLVSNMKNLRDLSIIGNPSAPNLADAKLVQIFVVVVVVLDVVGRWLTFRRLRLPQSLDELSDAVNNPAARSIRSLSLAFCFNFSSVGLQRLARMTKLDSLNLDGITKRDISSGLLKIAEEGRLIRLLLAEETNVSTDILREVVRVSPHLRLLDISNNEALTSWGAANSLVDLWVSSGRPSLTILTNNHLPWSTIKMPPSRSPCTPPAVSVVHLHRNTVAKSEIILGSVLSRDDSSQLPHGLLLPRLRRGNRYRLLCSLLSMSQELTDLDDQKENSCSRALHQPVSSRKPQKNSSTIPTVSARSNPSIPLVGVQHSNLKSSPMFDTSVVEKLAPSSISYLSSSETSTVTPTMLSDLCPSAYSADLSQVISPDMSKIFVIGHIVGVTSYWLEQKEMPFSGQESRKCKDFVLFMMVLTLEAWMILLSANQSYDTSRLSLTDPLSILTTGSAGAPRPPFEIPQQPRIHYTRGPRNKRRSNQQKRSPRTALPPVSFSSTDFPPLK
ncbi:unnamed protein product [Angiostrongylus costaricensis]|uniref:F-box domain-containing protein n=1 Tax=Angiostrongylus costaricensis TaxID=334426 RepID=A0A0R3Q016_ANGCS|nr:unnamed protein product [Angiostrongylus costaricensis]